MDKKKQIRGIMAGLFCIGVLMGGVGTGIAFADFSGFTYCQLDGSFQRETFTYQIKPEEEGRVWLSLYLGGKRCVIEEAADLPRGYVEIQVDYNSELCSPAMTTEIDDEAECWIYLYLNHHYGEWELFMLRKDQFLEGIKNREWRDYQDQYIKQAVYRVNPADRKRFRWN